MNRAIVWVIVAVVAIFGVWLIAANRDGNEVENNDVENVENGGAEKGNTIANLPVIGTQATPDEIVVESPGLGESISSPVTVTGRARGPWYFEASAPVNVIDTAGRILGQGYVEAQGDWMTTEFVPFRGTITFEDTDSEGGALIFMNDNPSGEESRAKYLAVPVFFD